MYAYNALGQRMRKSNQHGLSTVFHYGPNGELLWEKDANGNTRAYVWLDGRPLARIDNDASIYYYHVDHLGTPQAMSDSTWSLVWKANYEPFGKATVSPASTVENNLRFPGQYYDRETGLHYNYFRDYEPGTGRYVQSDPIGLAGGLNLYAYVGGNPISKTDPLGLCAADDLLCQAAVGQTDIPQVPPTYEQCVTACVLSEFFFGAPDTREYAHSFNKAALSVAAHAFSRWNLLDTVSSASRCPQRCRDEEKERNCAK